jgi:hypothetical protein
MTLIKALTVGVISWSVVSFAFVWLVYSDVQGWPVSPFLVAGSLPAGYVALVFSRSLRRRAWELAKGLLPLHFLISDTGLRFIQIQELIANNWQTLAISYPQRVFDPELQHLPYSGAALVIDDQLYLYLSPFFNIAAAFFYRTWAPQAWLLFLLWALF